MSTCTEFAVFKVKKANLARIVALSESLFLEINVDNKNIIAHEILVKTDNEEEICWHLTWANIEAVEASSYKWSTYPSASEIESLVGKKLYYGHFVAVFAN
ncbi:MAG TPA: hypothetical protein DIS98_05930 [Colwellia sp.]|nr:hypothetical protein [Colwellia sp.]|tara:strand:- start:332 stop:634 length:303 start_codon:yes stop_codon:yes gene_type:complete